MAGDLTGYRNYLLSKLGNEEALQNQLRENPTVDILHNGTTNQQQSVNILNPNMNTATQYDPNDMMMKSLNTEVETGLGTRIESVMSDSEKQKYLNSLTQEQYDQMLQYKNEGYGFMASKALLENSHKLADPTATGLLKYNDYAKKDAYYNNTWDLKPDSTLGKFATRYQKTFGDQTPTEYLANWWNTKYGEKVERGEETFLDRFGNMTFGALVNMLDTGSRGGAGIFDKASSKLEAKLDKDILGLDTSGSFYRQSDTNLVSDITKLVGTAVEMAVLGKFTATHPLGMLTFTGVGSTGIGNKAMDLTIGNIGRLVNWTLDTIPGVRAGYNTLDEEAKESLVNSLTLGVLHGISKYVSPKLANTKVGNYVGEVRTAVRNSLERGVKQGVQEAKIQAEVEKASGTKQYDYIDPETGESGKFDSFEGYDRWYKERVAKAGIRGFREGFRDGVYDEFQNVGKKGDSGTNPNLPGEGPQRTPKGSGGGDGTSGGGNNVNGKDYTTFVGKVKGKLGEGQLATENRMTKGDITKFNDKYGKSYTQWLIDHGFTNSYENNIQDLINYSEKVQKDKENILKLIPTRYTDSRVNKMLSEVLEHAEYVDSPELQNIKNLVLKNKQGGLTPSDVEYIRKYFSDYLFKDTEGKEAIRLRNIYDGVKNFLEETADKNGFSEYRELNKEISATEHIIIGTTKRANGIQANQPFGLKDAILLAGNMANPKMWSIMGFRLAWKNPEFKDKIINYLLKGRKPKEREQIKVDFEKIMKTVEANQEAEAQKQYEEFIKKWNIDTQPIENALGYNPEVGEFVDYSTPTMVTPEGQSKRWGQILETSKGEIKQPGTTKPAEKIVESVVNELVREGVLEKEVAETVKQNLLDNLSQQAQEKLAEVEQKIENGEELVEEEKEIVEKVADTIEDNKEDLQAKKIREFNENFEKQVDDKKLDEIREFVNEGGELKIVPIGIRKTVQLKNHGVMLSKAELDILKNEGLLGDQPKQIEGWYPIEGQTITVKSQPKEYQPTDSKVDKFVLDNMGKTFVDYGKGATMKIQRFADNGNIVATIENKAGDELTIAVLDKNDIMDKVENGTLKYANEESQQEQPKTETKPVQRDFKQGTLESENDIVEKIQNKEYGRFLQEVDGVIKLGLNNSFNNTAFQVASGDWQTAIKADITRDDKGEKVRFELGENTVQESIDTFNDILKKLKIQYIVGFKDENGQKVPTVMYKKTGRNDTMQMGKSFNGVATSKEYRLGDTDYTIQRNEAEKLQLEIDRVAHQATSELTDLKRDVAKNEERAEQAKLAEKRAGLQAYVDENYKAGIARTRAMQELTKPIYEGYVSGKGYVRNLHYYDLPENTEVREALDDLSKYNGEIKEVWERDYVDKNGERHDVYSYWYDYKDDPNAKTGHRIGLTKYQRDYMGYKLLQKEIESEEKAVAENPENYLSAEQEAYLFGKKPVEVETKEVIGKTDTMNQLQDKINAINSFDDLGDIFDKFTFINPFNDTVKTDYYYGALGGKDIVIWHEQGQPHGYMGIGEGIELVANQPSIVNVERYKNPIKLDQIKAKLLNADDEQINAMSQTVSWGNKNIGQIKETEYNSDNLQSNTKPNEQVGGLSTETNKGVQGDNGQLSSSKEVLGVSRDNTGTSSEESNGGNGITTDNVTESGIGFRTGGATRGQQRLNNKNAKQILEDHNFSTNANDYTGDELAVLKNYEGAGGLTNKGEDVTGVLDQFYTPQVIVNKMWGLVDKYKDGDIKTGLEPTVGTGRFLRDDVDFTAYEIDKFPGTIAQILNPSAKVNIGDFQNLFMDFTGKRTKEYNGPKYDLVIGNPPYSHRDTPQRALGDEKKIDRYEQYFIKKGIDVLDDNGLLVMIIPSTFLRNRENYAKQEILKNATLVDAYRLPSGVFANTEVGTDIVVFKKNMEGSKDISDNKWFEQHPEKVLGVEKERSNRFGGTEKYIEGDISELDRIDTNREPVAEKTKEDTGIKRQPEKGNRNQKFTNTILDIIETNGGLDDNGYLKIEKEPYEPLVIEMLGNNKVAIAQYFIQNGDVMYDPEIVFRIDTDGVLQAETYRNDSMGFYHEIPSNDKFLDTWNVNLQDFIRKTADEKANAYEKKENPETHEKKIETNTETKTKRKPATRKSKTDNTTVVKGDKTDLESKIVAVGDINNFDPKVLDYLEKNTVDGYVRGVDPSTDIDNLNYYKGNAVVNELYFAGDIVDKLKTLEEEKGSMGADMYEKQKKGLMEVLPQKYNIEDITFDPNDKELLEMGTGITKDTQGRVENEDGTTYWGRVSREQNIRDAFEDYIGNKVPRSSGLDKQEARKYLNGQPMDKEKKSQTKRIVKEYLNKFMQEEISEEVQNKLVDEYNNKLRSYVRPNYEGLPLMLTDISHTFRTLKDISEGNEGKPLVLSDGQIRGINFLLSKGTGLVAHGVGHGKTMEGVISTIEAMNRGWNKRPAFIVPGPTVNDNWIHTIKELYPDKEIVNLGGLTQPDIKRLVKELGPDPRNWIQDGQIAMMTHDAVANKLDFKTDTKNQIELYINDVMAAEAKESTTKQKQREDKVKTMVEATTKSSGKGYKYTVPEDFLTEMYLDMEGMTYEEFIPHFVEEAKTRFSMSDSDSLDEQAKQMWSERPIYIEDLGIDHITVDEAHNFKNLFSGAKMEETGEFTSSGKAKKEINRFGNIQGPTPSQQAKKLYFASQYVLANNNNRNVFMLTATPFNNHPIEVYNMLSFMARKRLKDLGINNINSFFTKFANFVSELAVKPSGAIEEKDVMKSFNNAEELQRIVTEFIDYLGDRPDLIKPKKVLISPIITNSELGQNVQSYLEELSMKDPKEVPGAMIKATGLMMSALISPYMVKEYFENQGRVDAPSTTELIENSPKLKFSIDVIKEMIKKGRKDGIFIYMPRYGGLGDINYHELFKKAISEYTGLSEDEIGIISGESKYKKDKDITAKAFRDGKIKVLIGGSNTTEGIDLQTNGYITINLLQGWNPTERTQLNGRVWRQGNFRNEVLEIVPMILNSGDAFMQQKFDEKSARGNNLFEFAGKVFDTEEMNHEEMKFNLITDVDKKVKTFIDMETAKVDQQAEIIGGDIATLQGLKEKKKQADEVDFYQEKLDQAVANGNDAQITIYKDALKKAKSAKKYYDEKMEQLQITDIDKEIDTKEKEIELLGEQKSKIKDQAPEIKRQFEEESIRQLENMKSEEERMKVIGEHIDNLKLFSDKQELKEWLDTHADEDLEIIEKYTPKKIEIKVDRAKVEDVPTEGHSPALEIGEDNSFKLDTQKDYSLLDLSIFAQTTDMSVIETIDKLIKDINNKIPFEKKIELTKTRNGYYAMNVPYESRWNKGEINMHTDKYKYYNSRTFDGIKRMLREEMQDQIREEEWRKKNEE